MASRDAAGPPADGSAITPNGGAAHTSVGSALRAIRLARSLTIADVARGTGISASFLSLVENGKSDITIGRVTRLVQFFEISLTDLLPAATGLDPDIIRKGEHRRLLSPEEGMDIQMLAPENGPTMMPMLLEFEPGGGRRDFSRHAGDEFVYVLDGEMLLELAGSEPRRLSAGDSAYYPGDRPHLWINASYREPLRVLCVDSSRML